jgi:hypothetical protein
MKVLYQQFRPNAIYIIAVNIVSVIQSIAANGLINQGMFL